MFAAVSLAAVVFEFAAEVATQILSSTGNQAASVAIQLLMLILGVIVSAMGLLLLFGCCLDVLDDRPFELVRTLRRLRSTPACVLDLALMLLPTWTCMIITFALMYQLADASSSAIVVSLLAAIDCALIVAAIHVATALVLAPLHLLQDPAATAFSAARNSFRLVTGHRWSAIGVLVTSCAIMLLGALACGIGFLVSGPISTLLFSAFYLALSTPAHGETS